MSTTHDLVAALKAELKAAGLTYADLAQQLGMAESSIKRIFAKGDIDIVSRVGVGYLTGNDVFRRHNQPGFERGAADPCDLGFHSQKIADVDRGVEAHGINRHRHHRSPGVFNGSHAARLIAQLHNNAAVDIAEYICLSHAHRLGQYNS